MTASIAVAAPHPLQEVFVLHARPLRDGMVLEQTSRFRDDRWCLEAACLQQHFRASTLNFAVIPARHRQAAKELCYAMLSGELPSGEPRPSLSTIRSTFTKLRVFLNWLHTRPSRPGQPARPMLADLTGHDLSVYQRHLEVTVRHSGTRATHRAGVRMLWRYRAVLTGDRLPFDPAHIDGWNPAKTRASENATDRIPEAVHGPLLAWAVRFIDDFAEDILAADRSWRDLRASTHRAPVGTNNGGLERLRSQLADYVARRRPLPGYRGEVNMAHLAAEAGCSRKTSARHPAEIDAAAAVVGISAHAYLNIPITGTLDGQPWIDGIVVDHNKHNGLGCLARMLQAAATIVILFLSGMREGEAKHLRRGCLQIHRDEQGRPYRWRVTSLAFKGETDPAGVEATWAIGAPAARAIQVLERLLPPTVDLLISVLDHNPRNAAATGAAMTNSATNHQLNDFVQWVNDHCAANARADVIPVVNNRTWRLTTRQFRRTLAWFVARRPGGVIAGAIAYRHHAIQMFEGYAGTSESGFRAEVESEQALARGENLLAMIDHHEHENLAGPAADEAARRLKEFGDRARFPGAVVVDRRRLDRLMRRDDPAVYPGKYATCVHKHETALCQQRPDSRGDLRPQLSSCKPLLCRNVALTTDNVSNLHDEVEAIERDMAARPLLPPLLHHRLQTRRDEIIAFLARHDPQEQP